MGILKLIGAVSEAEHEREIEVLEDLLDETRAAEKLAFAKFKEVERDRDQWRKDCLAAIEGNETSEALLRAEIAALRPDAEKWRDRAARESQRGQAKRDGAAKAVAAKGKK